jgi:hypothetical protein
MSRSDNDKGFLHCSGAFIHQAPDFVRLCLIPNALARRLQIGAQEIVDVWVALKIQSSPKGKARKKISPRRI